MIDRGKRSIVGVGVNVIDYDAAVTRVIAAAKGQRPLTVSALAVHGVMTGRHDLMHRYRLNRLALVVPDGQPLRWALRLLHNEFLPSRVYGPELMSRVCAAAAESNLAVYLYGSRPAVLEQLRTVLRQRYPALVIAGDSPSRFARVNDAENAAIIERIRMSGARITFVGLGCPRQEVWAYENGDALMTPVLAVGAAFDFHAGMLSQAPAWMQDNGLEWLYRLIQEPRRLWRRYLTLNPLFCWNVFLQLIRPQRFDRDNGVRPNIHMNFG